MRRTALALLLVACSRAPAEPTSSGATAAASAPAPSASAKPGPVGSTGTAPAFHWTDPPSWQRRPPANALRAAQYLVPRAGGDSEDGECVIMTFGPRQGGSVEDNVKRWTEQFRGGPPPVRSSREVRGMRVTRVEAAGTYAAMAMPGAGTPPTVYPGWRLIGAIVESPSGLWFFKMTGPDATVKASGPVLDQLVDSARSD
ncbi:MAG: hypothetical protein M3O50_11905 [Myxococcota bacterium]|nr:hypothetical protein [Myxococcota bacterium]